MFILLTDWASSLPNGIRLLEKKLSHGALIFIDTDNGPNSLLASPLGSSHPRRSGMTSYANRGDTKIKINFTHADPRRSGRWSDQERFNFV
ncbi:GD13955 [Drosophila simulans]|uniref:GD13955 n=1 Tax=Drosophila simulans TaxID=7240 RepID=B4QJE0_DROSI|nr:GD13955 [Drosophila simulans]